MIINFTLNSLGGVLIVAFVLIIFQLSTKFCIKRATHVVLQKIIKIYDGKVVILSFS